MRADHEYIKYSNKKNPFISGGRDNNLMKVQKVLGDVF